MRIPIHNKIFKLIFILVAAGVGFYLSCASKDSPTKSDDQTDTTEIEELGTLSENLIDAFKSGNADNILSYVNDQYKDIYSDIREQSASDLSVMGEALEKRELISISGFYAVYRITIDGQDFTVTYAQCGDDNWQLVGF